MKIRLSPEEVLTHASRLVMFAGAFVRWATLPPRKRVRLISDLTQELDAFRQDLLDEDPSAGS